MAELKAGSPDVSGLLSIGLLKVSAFWTICIHLQVFVNGVGGNICSILAEPSSSIRDVREVPLAFLANEVSVLHRTKAMTVYERWK